MNLNSDTIIATADLAVRSGAKDIEIGHLRDDVPVEEAGWWMSVTFQGAKIQTGEHRSPSSAALALAERLLDGATCRCKNPVTLTDTGPGCRWQLNGQRWEPGCDASPIHVKGKRGDLEAMRNALEAT